MNQASAIAVRSLCREYVVPVRAGGLGAALRSLVRRQARIVQAVRSITFALQPGEVVGFLGPSGAGKTTTLKMLAGLLYPSAGEALVLGHVPCRREHVLLREITLVMGNAISWSGTSRCWTRSSATAPSAASSARITSARSTR